MPTTAAVPVVPGRLRSWSVAWPAYSPVDITPAELRADGGLAESVREGWAEGATDPTTIDFAPRQAAALLPYLVVDGRPLNPTGRTGRTGRNLGLWGENAAADPVVIADTIAGPHVLLIRRSDCGQWAFPGGMVDAGETAPAALVRELREETGVDLSGASPVVLTRTYVDDPRNSDQAWVCSTVAMFHVPVPLAAVAADDATDARWFPFTSLAKLVEAISAEGGRLYAAHMPLLSAARERLAEEETA